MRALNPSHTCLDSVVVVEVGHRVGVGACGSLLAQLGATVFVVEPSDAPTTGKWRNRAAALAGKESVVLAQGNPQEAALLEALLLRADVVLLSTDDGSSLRTPWDAPRHPGSILCDLTAFGHQGPLAGRGGSEATVAALTGVLDTTGHADGAPTLTQAPLLEMSTAVFAASAVLAALRVRRLHGFGQRIDVTLHDTAVGALANYLPLYFESQRPTRSGNRHPLHVPWGSYRASDGFVLVCAAGDEQFSRLCAAIDAKHLREDPRFHSSASRLANFTELDAVIEKWTATRTVSECEAVLTPLGVVCGPITPVDRLVTEPNLQHRKSLLKLRDPVSASDVYVPAPPIRGVPFAGRAATSIPEPGSGRARMLEWIQASQAERGELVTGDLPSDVRPLAGVRVIEIGQFTVAPLASRQLGALGADVIKIEPPAGDAVRHAAPLRADGQAHIFAISNTDKRGLVLDLRLPAHRDMLDKLLDSSDLLIENTRPGALAKFGFDSAGLRHRHPRLVYCSVNGFGNDSAYPSRRALDTVIQAMSGIMSLTPSNGAPTKTGISVSDMLGGQFGLLAALAGLECRDRSGAVVHFDLSMQDASVWATQAAWPGSLPAEPATVLAASDGYVLASCSGSTVVDVVGDPPWAGTRAELTARLAAAGISSVPILAVDEAIESAHVAERKLLIDRLTGEGGTWRVLECPLNLRSTPGFVRSVMSRLGADDEAIISEFALDRDDIPPSPSKGTS